MVWTFYKHMWMPSDMKGHTGGLMTMGLGILQGKATKQKLNAKSSTEAELIGASDYVPWTVWVKWFLKDQGYKLNRCIFYQDNQSAMKLESNGMRSAGDKSRHINIRFFLQGHTKEGRDRIDTLPN